jgi:hypothetical protein
MSSDLKQNIIVYHGSTSLIETIDVAKGKPYKDFGRGFYVTQSRGHARNIAQRNKRLDQERYGQECAAYVYAYTLDMNMARSFTVKEFAVADLDWMRFILANRRVRGRSHSYDIVIGPTANDDTSLVLKSYFSGLYGDVESERAVQLALDLIEAENLPEQIYFGSNDATACLKQKGTVQKI